MKNFSITMGGIILAVAVPALVQWGLTDSCANEVAAKVVPILSSLPGAVMAWIGRVRAGGVTMGGFKKKNA